MASQILSNMTEKAKNMTGEKSQKIADLSKDTKDVHDPSYRITSDFGVKQTNTDDWLAVVSEDQQGPQLLEDPFGREKVCPVLLCRIHNKALTT
jgi:catalase